MVLYISMSILPSRIDNIKTILESINGQHPINIEAVIIHCPKKCLRLNIPYDIEKLKENVKGEYRFKVIINEIPYDYGPISKLYPIIHLDYVKDNDLIIVVDDDKTFNPCLFFWLLFNFNGWGGECCIATSGIKYPTKLNDKLECKMYGHDADFVEGSFGYILKRSFIGDDFKNWVIEVDNYDDVKRRNFYNSFIVDDNVIGRYLDSRGIRKKVMFITFFIDKDTACTSLEGMSDSLCMIDNDNHLNRGYMSELELRLLGLIK